jgi:hypothetical protein
MAKTALQSRLFPGDKGDVLPWIVPPPGFVSVDRNRSLVVAPGPETLIERINLDLNMEGWIVLAGIFASSYSSFFFTIKAGLQPIRDYVRITVPLGQTDSMDPMLIKITPNEPVGLYATNAGGAPVGVRYRLFGWYYPIAR